MERLTVTREDLRNINSNFLLDSYLKDHFPSEFELAAPLFYNADIGIRFEIGNPDPALPDEEYRDQVAHRALTLFKDVHQDDDEVLVVLYFGLKRSANPQKIKAFYHALKHRKVIRSLSCIKLQRYDDEDEGWESYRYVLKCKCSDLKYRRILFAPNDIYFINMSRHSIFHFYDSRGLDIVSNSKEVLEGLYLKRNEWILDYDRERIDSIFKNMNRQSKN